MKLMPILIEWSISSALLILAVTILRSSLGKRVSAGLRYSLWAVVLIRLLVPVQLFSYPVPVSVLPEPDREQLIETAPLNLVSTAPGATASMPAIDVPLPNGVLVEHNATTAPVDIAANTAPVSPFQILGWLWIAGSAIMAAALLVSNIKFARRLRRACAPLDGVDCPLPVYIAGGLPSPCLFGLIHPAIYATSEAADDPVILRHVLVHEYTHFRHGDHIWNILRSIALAIHWWNPLVWLAVVLSGRDCELACDEGALKRLGDGERVAYGRTLLVLLTVKPRAGDLLTCATTMTGGQKSVFDRVTRIAHAPKRWLWAAVVAVLAAALACVCAFGSTRSEPDADPAAPSPEPSAPA
ncbi:MAG: M56 family metallopeptidase, partial [Oscillospiraceae bacterium]|nr:M56 family metallopeptidase [Oscillospiraceae bacterium]